MEEFAVRRQSRVTAMRRCRLPMPRDLTNRTIQVGPLVNEYGYLEVLAEQERGENLRPNQVPATFLFAFAGARVVGRVAIRHTLTLYLERFGGHIGYVVVPEHRRQGYATAILRQSLQIARQRLGLRRVLATCDDDNVGSMKTIEKNGGVVLESIVTDQESDKPKRRYWIATLD